MKSLPNSKCIFFSPVKLTILILQEQISVIFKYPAVEDDEALRMSNLLDIMYDYHERGDGSISEFKEEVKTTMDQVQMEEEEENTTSTESLSNSGNKLCLTAFLSIVPVTYFNVYHAKYIQSP